MPLTTVECPTCKRPVPIEQKDVHRTNRGEKTEYHTRCVCGQEIFGWLEPASINRTAPSC